MFNVDVFTNRLVPCDSFSISESTKIVEDREALSNYTIVAAKVVDAKPNYFVRITEEDGTKVVDSIVRQVTIVNGSTQIVCCSIYAVLDFNSPSYGMNGLDGYYFSASSPAESLLRYGTAHYLNLINVPNTSTWTVSETTVLSDYADKRTVNIFEVYKKYRGIYTSIKLDNNAINVHIVHQRATDPRYSMKTFSLNIDDPNVLSYSMVRKPDIYNACLIVNDNPSASGKKVTEYMYYLSDTGTVSTDSANTSEPFVLCSADHVYTSGGSSGSEAERLAIAKKLMLGGVDMSNGISVVVKSNDLTFKSIDFDTVSNGVIYYDNGTKYTKARFTGWERNGDITTYRFGSSPTGLTDKLRQEARKREIESRI